MKLLLAAILAASIAGCTSDDGDRLEVSVAPGVSQVSHGYETEDGRVESYGTVDTGADAGQSGGDGDYSGRAVAR